VQDCLSYALEVEPIPQFPLKSLKSPSKNHQTPVAGDLMTPVQAHVQSTAAAKRSLRFVAIASVQNLAIGEMKGEEPEPSHAPSSSPRKDAPSRLEQLAIRAQLLAPRISIPLAFFATQIFRVHLRTSLKRLGDRRESGFSFAPCSSTLEAQAA
jgi:hypothetical protein